MHGPPSEAGVLGSTQLSSPGAPFGRGITTDEVVADVRSLHPDSNA
jgi:hypothetical protein